MWFWSLLTTLVFIQDSEQYEGRVVCYYRSDNVYRAEGFRMQPQEIDANLCTHIIYYTAYLHPEEAIASSDPLIDLTRGGYKKIVRLKDDNPDLKVMLSLSTEPGSRDLWPLISSRKSTRQWFSSLVIDFLRAHRFDGLDLDWQIENGRRDANGYLRLLKDLRQEMDLDSQSYNFPPLELSVLLPAQIQLLHRHFQLSNVSKYVDFINVASMDYWSLDPDTVQHHAPLYRNVHEGSLSQLNVDESIKYFLFKCVPPEKINLGIPTYGRSFVLNNYKRYALGSLCKYPGDKGFATQSPGTLAYFEICTYINEDFWLLENMNLTSMGPFAHFDDRWVGFDDVGIVSVKAKYAREKKLGGLMFWTIDQDDFRGYCRYKNALIRAGKFTLSTGIPVWDSITLEAEERKLLEEEETGYYYPKPTIKQPITPWTIILQTTEMHELSTNTPTTTTTAIPVEITTIPNVETTLDVIPLIMNNKETRSTTPKSYQSTTIKNSLPTSTKLPVLTQTPSVPVTTPTTTPTSTTVSSTTGRTTSQPQDTTTIQKVNDNTSTTEPTTQTPNSILSVPTISNSIDSDSADYDSNDNNAILQLNRVLATVNQVVADINEVTRNQAKLGPNTNLTIDPSFLEILQPLLNIRNSADFVLENSESGKRKNTTVSVQSDIKKYSNSNNNILKRSNFPFNLTSLSNLNISASDLFGNESGVGYLINSGRDIININLNISVNNHYYNMDEQ